MNLLVFIQKPDEEILINIKINSNKNKFLYIDKCKYDRNKYNDSSYSGGNKLLILFV